MERFALHVLAPIEWQFVRMDIIVAIAARMILQTDEHRGYKEISGKYEHHAINHSAAKYVRGEVNMNRIESVWALLKRCVHGVDHHTSHKYLANYVNDFTFRLNDANVDRHSLERLESLVTASFGQRLPYQTLIA